MDTEHVTQGNRPTSSNPQASATSHVPLRALLAELNPRALRLDAERLAAEDLRALGGFSAQPHPLVHRCVAVALALLLSLSPAHAALDGDALAVRPWAVLRLELLADAPDLWRRLRVRGRALETGSWVLSPAQVRFASRELLRFLLKQRRELRGDEMALELSLEPVARVSSIAAALAAWTCLCLLHACGGVKSGAAPVSPIKIVLAMCGSQCEEESASYGRESVDQTLTRRRIKTKKRRHEHLPLPQLAATPRDYQSQPLPAPEPTASVSYRAALKVGGRFVLFHAIARGGDDSVDWSLLALDANWNHRRRRSGGGTASQVHRELWMPLRPVSIQLPTVVTDCVSLSRLPRTALKSVLMQLASHAGVLRSRHSVSSLSEVVGTEQLIRGSTVLQSHFLVVTRDAMDTTSTSRPCGGWSITAVGRAALLLDAHVSSLRVEVLAALARDISQQQSGAQEHQSARDDLQFVFRGALLSRQQEASTRAASLLPVAMLVRPPDSPLSGSDTKMYQWSTPLRLQRQVTEQLINCGVQSLNQLDQLTVKTEAMGVRQPVSSDTSLDQSTASIVTEILRNWEAFVQLQRLQDDPTVVFQLSPNKTQRVRNAAASRRQTLDEFLASHQDDSDGKPKDSTPQPPRKRFDPRKEFLLPLYATAEVVSPSKALLSAPSAPSTRQLLDQLKPNARLALMDELHVVHIQAASIIHHHQCGHSPTSAENEDAEELESDNGRQGEPCVEVTFERDASCSDEDLQHFHGVYVWLIASRRRSSPHQDLGHREDWPPRWLCSIYRHVTHPVVESSSTRGFNRFRVAVAERDVELAVESTFWSQSVDWEPYLRSTDIHASVLSTSFELLCRSHPPSTAIDSVKFSKLLRECGVQPKFLTVGDAAYLFASHLASGSHYEMVFDGFERALERVADLVYAQRQSELLSPLRKFCFDRLVHAPSMSLVWRDVVDSWRVIEKQRRMQAFADGYCAATRIRALWKQVSTRRVHIQTLERLKAERLAATSIQSVWRMRRVRVEFGRLRVNAIRLQVRVKARSQLCRLRRERVAFVESMRVKLVRWMRSRLRVLRAWKQLNEVWVARRDRIWGKRQRMMAAAAVCLETRCVRFYLYRSKAPVEGGEAGLGEDIEMLELEVVDSDRSSCIAVTLTKTKVAGFEVDERRRMDSSTSFFSLDRWEAMVSKHTTVDGGSQAADTPVVQAARPGLRARLAKPRPNAMLEAIVGRIRFSDRTETLRFYSNPVFTSLGKRLFFGVVRCGLQYADLNSASGSRYRAVKLLQRADALAMTVFTPATATTRRFDITAAFAFRVLQCMQFGALSLPSSTQLKPPVDQAGNSRALMELVGILRGPRRLQALRCIVSYLEAFGVEEPTHSMMPEVRAERQRVVEEEQRRKQAEALARETESIVRVQSRGRQLIARAARRRLALRSYQKVFDRQRQQFVYVLASVEREEDVVYDRKPASLFDCDVPMPVDEWKPVVDRRTGRVLHYANAHRGMISRFNDVQAAQTIQRRFRRFMWVSINSWGLRQLVAALQFHRSVDKPTAGQLAALATDASALENAKRYALQLHVLHHDYKAAFAMYEALLKVSPQDPEVFACLAVLLIASCRYPAKQTWVRAQQLLQEVATALAEASALPLPSALAAVEDSCFCWSLFMNPRDPEAIVNYAVFLQCVRRELDKAEILYRRGLDVAPSNERLVENYRRLRTHRAPDGLYAFAGPGKVALTRAHELSRCGRWREMEDTAALTPSASRFFYCPETGECVWTLPVEESSTSGAS